KACEEIGITGLVQTMLLRCLKKLDSKTKINDPKSFNGKIGSMDALVKACYENSRDILNKERFFENRPEISFVRKLMRCHYFLVGKSNPLSVKTIADNLFKVTDLETEINAKSEEGINDMSVDNLFKPNSLSIYQSRRNGMPRELDRIQGIINTLNADKKKLQDEIDFLKSNNPLLEQENQDLKNANDNLKNENDNLKTSNKGIKKENEELKNQIKPLTDKIHDLEEENKKIKAENEENTKENLQYEETLRTLNSIINTTIKRAYEFLDKWYNDRFNNKENEDKTFSYDEHKKEISKIHNRHNKQIEKQLKNKDKIILHLIDERKSEQAERQQERNMDARNNMTKAQLLAKINELTTTFEEQKNETKENHTNEISLFREIITAKNKEITNLMSIIDNHAKEIERIDEMRKKHEYEYNERLKEKDKIHKREKEERERTYKWETDLLHQTIDHLEQTIRSLQI
ncbi:9861_t:CDS:2, partial [Racocetra persica]